MSTAKASLSNAACVSVESVRIVAKPVFLLVGVRFGVVCLRCSNDDVNCEESYE
jgi:hypothetical protein